MSKSPSPWGNIGAWAAEAERAEAEEREAAAKAEADAAAQPQPSFPSLKESVTTAKQKKKTKMTLQEFTMQQTSYSGSAASRGLTPDEMFRLPTGPKERSPEEMQYGRLGGGFSNYGTRSGSVGSNQGRPREYEGRRSYGFDDDNRREGPPQGRVSEFDQPSRADGVDNWASMKKQTLPGPVSGQMRTGSKYSSLGGGGGYGVASRADEVDNWASVKKPISQPQQQIRSSSFGSGFPRPESDRWTRNEQRFALDSHKIEDEVVVKVNKPNPFGAARPREEVLAEKGLDWKKLDLDIEEKKQQNLVSGGSRPASSHSSRPGTPLSSKSEVAAVSAPSVGDGAAKQKPKVNPFGDAKPREVLLEEKGLDWKKIDLELEHRRVERPETEEEKKLKEEIEHLNKELQEKSGDDQTSISELVHQKEQELEQLVHQLDGKIRYSQKIFDRQSLGAGKGTGLNERPPSQSGDRPPSQSGGRPPSRPGDRPPLYEESRVGFHDRPHPMQEAYEEPRQGYQERSHSRPGIYEDPRAGFMEKPPAWNGGYEDPRSGFVERPPSRPVAYEDPQPGFHDRPRSRPGTYEEPRGGFPQRSAFPPGAYQDPRAADYNDRPRSRGSMNSWNRPIDDRRAFQGGGGRGFLGSRDTDRSGARW